MHTFLRKKIKLNLEYNHQHLVVEIEPYRTFKYLKEKMPKLFFPISNDIKILMNNRDQSQFDESQIGDVYKNKQNLTFKIVDNEEFKRIKTEESFKLLDYVAQENEKSNEIVSSDKEKENEKQLMDKLARKTHLFRDDSKTNVDQQIENPQDAEYLCSCKSGIYIGYFCRKCKDFICKACRINVRIVC